MAKKISKKSMSIEDLSFEDDYEDNTFSDVIVGTPVSSFSFNNDTTTPTVLNVSNENLNSPITKLEEVIDNRKGKPKPYGITPPIDDEAFDIKRTYTFRKSTVRKLNELKAQHPDINAYLSSIIDTAVNYYYNYVFLEDGEQK